MQLLVHHSQSCCPYFSKLRLVGLISLGWHHSQRPLCSTPKGRSSKLLMDPGTPSGWPGFKIYVRPLFGFPALGAPCGPKRGAGRQEDLLQDLAAASPCKCSAQDGERESLSQPLAASCLVSLCPGPVKGHPEKKWPVGFNLQEAPH